jgi:crossover junction endodeoxyribonuclease RusA
MIQVTLPWPPSVNGYWRKWRGRMVISVEGRKYREAVIKHIWEQGMVKRYECNLKVTIEAHRPDNRRRDLDNLLKSTLDSLQHADVFGDDNQIRDLRIYWSPDIGGMLKITIEEMQ